MSVTPLIGITGDVVMPTGFTIGVKSGTLTLSLVPIDVTTTADAGNQKVLGGMRKARGSCVGVAKTGAASVNPGFSTWQSTSSATLPLAGGIFKLNGSVDEYSFNMLLTNIRVSFNYAGQTVLSFDFESDGPITETWG